MADAAAQSANSNTMQDTLPLGSAASQARRRLSRAESLSKQLGQGFGGLDWENFLTDETLNWDNDTPLGPFQYEDPQHAIIGHGQDPYFLAIPENTDIRGFMRDDSSFLQAHDHRGSIGMTNQPFVALPNADLGASLLEYPLDLHLVDSNYQTNDFYMGHEIVPYEADSLFIPKEQHTRSPIKTVASEYPTSRQRARSGSYGTAGSGVSRRKARTSSCESSQCSISVPTPTTSRRTSVSLTNPSAKLRDWQAMKHRASAAVRYKIGDQPKTDDARPWIRVNATTKGDTTRTSKINNYTANYEERPHPLGTGWDGPKHRFDYTPAGEFKEKTMSAPQIKEFILHYPRDQRTAKLKLWLQKGPTDSARRYKTNTWSKCRFRNCPAQVYQTGTILHGHYRIAFDEKWHRDRENADPFLTTGYVHLYCMERFLDFPEICTKADVEVDTRSLTNEPKAHFAATLAGAPESGIGIAFIENCRRKKLQQIDEFKDYPCHADYKHGEPKPHEKTLTYWMTKIKAESRPPAQIRQFQARGLKNTHLVVNLGDLEVLFGDVIKNRQAKKANRKKTRHSDDEEQQLHPKKTRTTSIAAHSPPQYQFTPRSAQRKSKCAPMQQNFDGGEDTEPYDPLNWAQEDSDDDFNAPVSFASPPQRSGLRFGPNPRLRGLPPINYSVGNPANPRPPPQASSQQQLVVDTQLENVTGLPNDHELSSVVTYLNSSIATRNDPKGLWENYNYNDHEATATKELNLDFLNRRQSSRSARYARSTASSVRPPGR
ncbi:uncharacterized protein BDR25DRAFT_370553 [Lindgomyces ingoldianus]|uniref:Uncharacterized protein n=1 Tax=Lindgomyces ingoldianus TaxID=673940 RepID=A0ACB6QTJ0_9PLEO|nr:uncharacterized protein BDR25DRAFT_370553 [Lindgomyces ingoldianus]KAF2469883.1 hypothetical protein BDR25DRAFT_370553 [Lindgomyces ingoldianus]